MVHPIWGGEDGGTPRKARGPFASLPAWDLQQLFLRDTACYEAFVQGSVAKSVIKAYFPRLILPQHLVNMLIVSEQTS